MISHVTFNQSYFPLHAVDHSKTFQQTSELSRSVCLSVCLPVCLSVFLRILTDLLLLLSWLLLWRELPNECPEYETKQSDGEVPMILELWGMRSTSSLPSLPSPLWSGMVAPDRVLTVIQIELNLYLWKNWVVWNRTVSTFNWTVLISNCV